MPRPVTLFTGQWADLPIAELAAKCGEWGFDGLELASWGDHFDVARALSDDGYCKQRRELLESHGLGCWAVSNHLVGQAVCDPIDARHEAIVPPEVWGDGDPDGVRSRAAERMKDTARAAARFGVDVVTGFTGSPVWHMLYSFPPNDFAEIERGYERFAEAWGPIIDVYDAEGVRFALEVHPTEIAYDFVTTRKALAAMGHRPGFGINFDPSHLEPQLLDSAAFVDEFAPHVHHVHVKDSKRRLDGRRSILGSHLNFGDNDRGWDFVSPGHGDVDFESLFRSLITGDNYGIGYQAGNYFADELKCSGNVVEIQGIAGIPVTEQRSQGFRDALKRKCQDGVKIVASQPADFVPDKGLSVMENILQAQKQIDAVYTHDDDMAEGVVSAIQNAGREDEMFLTGAGGSNAAMDQIKEGGLYRATFLYNPSMSASAIRMARLIVRGQGFEELTEPEVPQKITVPATTVTKDNVDDVQELGF